MANSMNRIGKFVSLRAIFGKIFRMTPVYQNQKLQRM
jgi:hypothetical protein